MEFRILGPLEVREGGAPVTLGGRRQRALLARLLLEPGRTVAVDQLVDDLWGEDVPGSAVKMVHIYVSQLRKLLPADALLTHPPGYALQIEPGTLDLDRFAALREAGLVPRSQAVRPRPRRSNCERPCNFGAARRWPSSPSRSRAWRPPGWRSSSSPAWRTGSRRTSRWGATRTWSPSSRRWSPAIRCASACAGSSCSASTAPAARRRRSPPTASSAPRIDEQLGLEPSLGLRELERRILQQDPALGAPAHETPFTPPAAAQAPHPELPRAR